jgi:uncharacterized membrane protein YeaQ/YmgE (transglycosylase-associated protein family)
MSTTKSLLTGSSIGWLTGWILGTDDRREFLAKVAVGVPGVFLGGWILGGFLGTWNASSGGVSLGALSVPFLLAAILLIIARLGRISA